MLIPPNFFPELNTVKPPFILIEVPFCSKNEEHVKVFLQELRNFTSYKFDFGINWKTKKVRQLFSLKESNPHPACKIYEGKCDHCNATYIGETLRNTETRWSEHEDAEHNSEPARHLKQYPQHRFTWRILCNAPADNSKRKYLEASYIANRKPDLNDQVEFKLLSLFRNGVT